MIIRINVAALRAAATRNQRVEQIVDETRARMNEMAARLGSTWDGGASKVAIDGLRELSEQGTRIGAGCQEITQKLFGVADAFEAVDSGATMCTRLDSMVERIVVCPTPFINAVPSVLGQLRIEPDEVRAVGAGCKEVANIYADTAAELQSILGELMGEWEGRSASRFAEEIHEFILVFRKMQEVLLEYGDGLFNAADRYEDLDNMLAN